MTETSVTEFASLDEVDFTGQPGPIVDFAVHMHGLRWDCRLNRRVAADHMYVTFHGPVDRAERSPPVFARWNWHMIYRAPILSLSDPLLHLHPHLQIAWFIGTREIDVADVAASIILEVADRLGIPDHRVVCYGSSAAGYAAIAVASRMQNGRFAAVNSLTRLYPSGQGHIRAFSQVFDSHRTAQENAAAYPERWSVIEGYRAARANQRRVRGVILQNKTDSPFYLQHFLPFCNSLSIPAEGGYSANGEVRAVVFEDERGHYSEDAPFARTIATDFVPWVLDAGGGSGSDSR